MPNRTEAAQRKLCHAPPGGYSHCACSRLHTAQAETDLSGSESVQAMAESTLHLRLNAKRSGRLMLS